jgi:retron-type reverse transcriptase
MKIRQGNGASVVVERLYRIFFNEEMYYVAYQRIYAKPGNMTAGADGKTIDQMSLNRIEQLITSLKDESYQPQPSKRVYIPKKNGKMRPLGVPAFNDKLFQDTALSDIQKTFSGVKWFVEGDIKGFFDNINHEILIGILKERIADERFIRLIRKFLNAGYIEDWNFHNSYSGTPQGGIVSPILANIYLDKLDKFMKEYTEKFDKGKERKRTKQAVSLEGKRHRILKKLKVVKDKNERSELIRQYKAYQKEGLQYSDGDEMDMNYRKLKYVRYADDFLIGISGSREDCEEIKEILREFLSTQYHLELSAEKTKITHSAERVRFLGYDVAVRRSQKIKKKANGVKQRTLNNSVELTVPLEDKIMQFLFKNDIIEQKPNGEIWAVCVPRLRHLSEVDIVNRYNAQIRGICNYYCLAANYDKLNYFRYLMEYSCLKTLASKSNSTTRKIIQKYRHDGKWAIPHEVKGGIKYAKLVSLADCKAGKLMSDKDPWQYKSFDPKKLSQYVRLSAGVCELCGDNSDSCCIYHAGKMKNLKSTTEWGKKMLHMRRKTLIVCPKCFKKIHREQNK